MARTQKKIDPVMFAAHALKQVKSKSDYCRIVAANKSTDIEAAWASLSPEDQERITNLCNNAPPTELNAIAQEIIACGTFIQLQAVKASHGEDVTRSAWKLISMDERRRLKALCDQGHQQQAMEPQPVTEQPALYQVSPQPPKRSLHEISLDMHQSSDDLEAKLDAIDDPDEQAQLIDLWLQQNAGTKDEMLERVNAYIWVIRKQKQMAEYRATEGKRLQKLAEQSENLAKRLEGHLLNFMDAHNLGKLETAHFKVSPRHASTEPLIVDESYPLAQVPDEFIVVSKTINRKLAKEAIKAGQQLPFATLGNKSRYLYIR